MRLQCIEMTLLSLAVFFAITSKSSFGYYLASYQQLAKTSLYVHKPFTKEVLQGSISSATEKDKNISFHNILASLLVTSSMIFTAPNFVHAISFVNILGISSSSSSSTTKDQYNIYDPPSTPEKGFQTTSGLKYFDLSEGDIGISPRYGQMVSFRYSGYYKQNGDNNKLELFDSSYLQSKNTPFLQKHGNGRIIRGIDEGLHTMKGGGLRRIVIPKSIGYTDIGLGPLPDEPSNRRKLGGIIDLVHANQGDMIFDLELLVVADDENDEIYYFASPNTLSFI